MQKDVKDFVIQAAKLSQRELAENEIMSPLAFFEWLSSGLLGPEADPELKSELMESSGLGYVEFEDMVDRLLSDKDLTEEITDNWFYLVHQNDKEVISHASATVEINFDDGNKICLTTSIKPETTEIGSMTRSDICTALVAIFSRYLGLLGTQDFEALKHKAEDSAEDIDLSDILGEDVGDH